MRRYGDAKRTPTPEQATSGARRDAAILALQATQPLAYGTTTLVAGTKAVSLATITAGSTVILSPKSLAGTIGVLGYTISGGVGFTITSVSVLDVSSVSYVVLP